ncbi:MAG: thioredoxin [candidate division Zixibacteria bacterium RBG_16_40_9]|nr:MAG: thioredoxin [candidate division Zixibacteria bacterium RBG_16_40_9]
MGEKKDSKTHKYSNRLANEKSPYLLQHANNPVDWYPWGEEAFAKAKKEDKPIFLSIGYSTCHWCHVMEKESFENEEIAKILNENFVAIKVDREERPDLDNIYMQSVMAMTGGGGWPLSVFLTSDKKPFFGGTYFPPEDRYRIPSFKKVLLTVSEAWKNQREELLKSAISITDFLQKQIETDSSVKLSQEILEKAFNEYSGRYDSVYGGFGSAPKFPSPHNLSFLLRYWHRTKESQALEVAEKTLQKMAYGGIHDHIGGGFHRYSTDARWLVPHFEKMLYDQATLSKAYLEAYQVTKNELYAEVAKDIFNYVLRDTRDKQGGFYSAEDADSEGEEGKFYVWRPEEVKKILGEKDAEIFNSFYGILELGNFENKTSILNVTVPMEEFAKKNEIQLSKLKQILETWREKLFSERGKRIHPHKDDKILTDWNGLMISSLALGYQVLGDKTYLTAAQEAADFILNKIQRDGNLLKRYRDGEASMPGYLDDYAFFVAGLIDLYQASFEVKYLKEAIRLTNDMVDLFWDNEKPGFFFSGKNNEELISKTKEFYDGAIPSGNSVAALDLLRLGRLTMNTDWEKKASQMLQNFSGTIQKQPAAYAQMLCALDFHLGSTKEIVLAGDLNSSETQQMLKVINERFLPRKVLAFHSDGKAGAELEKLILFTEGFKKQDGKTTAYICENYICQRPTSEMDKLVELLE